MGDPSSLGNEALFQSAQQVIPGGVNSPVRAFRSVGGVPPFISRAQGATLWDEEGNSYTDYVGSWGPAIAGHAHPRIIEAVCEAATKGLSFGAPTKAEVELADRICALLPSIEMVRLTSSGTEATMSAIRLARGFTGRDQIIKFEGCYHGHADSLLVKAGSGLLTFGNPSSAGVPADFAKHTIVLEYNNASQVEETFKIQGNQIAAIIVEPIAGNMNLVKPQPGFLEMLRRMCDEYGAILIFDEVMTGFRVGLQGAQGLFNIVPDLTTLGKVIGGGMPVGAFGGRRDIMEQIAPLGPVYQAGTLSGSPVCVAAGNASLELITEPGFYDRLSSLATALTEGLSAAARAAGIALSAQSVGGMFGFYFRKQAPQTFSEVMESDTVAFNRFFHGMLHEGHYLAPSSYESGFVSAAHTAEDIDRTVEAAHKVFQAMRS